MPNHIDFYSDKLHCTCKQELIPENSSATKTGIKPYKGWMDMVLRQLQHYS